MAKGSLLVDNSTTKKKEKREISGQPLDTFPILQELYRIEVNKDGKGAREIEPTAQKPRSINLNETRQNTHRT